MSSLTIYTVAYCRVSWSDPNSEAWCLSHCGHAHRRPDTAYKCARRLNAPYRDPQTASLDIRVMASDCGNINNLRELTAAEAEALTEGIS